MAYTTDLFLTVLETGIFKIKVLAGFISGENLLPADGELGHFSHCPHMVEGEETLLSLPFLIKTPFQHAVPPTASSKLACLPKTPTSNTTALGDRASTFEC